MKIKICTLLICLLLISQASNADKVWEEEDAYFGVQFSVPLDDGPKSDLFSNAKSNILLINSTGGYADGIAIGFDKLEFRSLSYLRPSSMLGVSQNSVRNHSIELLAANSGARSINSNVVLEAGTIVMYGVVGFILLGDALKDLADDLKDDDKD